MMCLRLCPPNNFSTDIEYKSTSGKRNYTVLTKDSVVVGLFLFFSFQTISILNT